MELKVTIDEKELEELITLNLVKQIMSKNEYRYDMKKSIGESVKQHIYQNKDEIIERVVERASTEIVKKALPKLLENLK